MSLDRTKHYVFRIGSDNQHRIHWSNNAWHYEFLAGGVLFDQLKCADEQELENAVAVHGMTLDRFVVDHSEDSAGYSQQIQQKMNQLIAAGIDPCAKHGLMSKNMDNTCEACSNTDYPDDFKGTEG